MPFGLQRPIWLQRPPTLQPPLELGWSAKPLSSAKTRPLPRAFPEQMGRAWLKHNVEEVGYFEHFLPSLYRNEAGEAS